jgi:hypothetical protein
MRDVLVYFFIILRKLWYEFIDNEIINSSPEFSKSTQLTLTYISSNE